LHDVVVALEVIEGGVVAEGREDQSGEGSTAVVEESFGFIWKRVRFGSGFRRSGDLHTARVIYESPVDVKFHLAFIVVFREIPPGINIYGFRMVATKNYRPWNELPI